MGRPRRGTEPARSAALLTAATRVFLREGYGLASIDKVASEAGVSTRTIYERYKNKAELLAAVIMRLVDQDLATVPPPAELARLDPREALTAIGRTITNRGRDPESVALFRIVVTEALRFPELAAKTRQNGKLRLERAVAEYLRSQVRRGTLELADADRAAALFLHMVFSELHDCLLFGRAEAVAAIDFTAHLEHVIDIFLYGAAAPAHRPSGRTPP